MKQKTSIKYTSIKLQYPRLL